tara:strand:- start:2283 stop:2480 length:198 start_codon:yes stop_codon:yes gene_type:complete
MITELKQLENALAAHDWLYQYSDDFAAYKKGRSSLQRIKSYLNTLKEKGYEDEAKKLYQKYSNKL